MKSLRISLIAAMALSAVSLMSTAASAGVRDLPLSLILRRAAGGPRPS